MGRKYAAILIPAQLTEETRGIEIEGTLEALQKVIGGHIELVRTSQGMMVVDEEGLVKGLPQNERAARLYPAPTGIAGDAVLFTYAEFEAYDQELA